MNNFDVIIVGACTAGTYFSMLLAKNGLNVLVIDKEKEEELCKRLDIFHFTRDSYNDFDIEISNPGDEEYVCYFDEYYSKSALDNYPKASYTKVDVMHLPLFIKRLRKQAIDSGVKFIFEHEFENLIYKNNKIVGITTKNNKDFYAKLIVDASGISSVIRTKINNPYMENFIIGPEDKFYVLLKYVDLVNEKDNVSYSVSWPYYKAWIAPQHNKNGAIIGIGANLSYEYAYKCMEEFERKIKLPDYTFSYKEIGCTPYRRPPYSFVCDNFMVIGDAACLTKPWNGEGIPSAWVQCDPAAKIIASLIKKNTDLTVKSMWEINKIYQSGEGAEYASTRAMLVKAVNMNEKDNDYLFKHDIIFKDEDKPGNQKILKTLLNGLIKKQFSFHGFISLVQGFLNSNAIKKHYLKYPRDPKKYFKWKKKADRLWKKAGNMADCIKKDKNI